MINKVKSQKSKVKSSKFVVYSVAAIFIWTVLLSLPTTNYQLPTAYAQQATLALSPSTGTYNRSCNFPLDININTGGADTDGTDVILTYDPSRFSVASITPGTIYPEFPGNNTDETNGKITISGLASSTNAYRGSGKLATVNFTVKPEATTGVTQITFDFDPQDKTNTRDSNVVQSVTNADILNSVVNGSYTIGEGVCGGSAAPTNPPVGRGGPTTDPNNPVPAPSSEVKVPYQPPPPLNNTANTELTYTIAIVGSSLIILGVLGLVLL